MKNFKPRHNRRENRTRYEYLPAESGEMVKLAVSHRDGGRNYFSGADETRGVEIVVTHVTLCESGTPGVRIENSTPMSSGNGRLLVLETARYGAKKVESVARVFDERAPELVRLWKEDPAAGRKLLMELAEAAKAA